MMRTEFFREWNSDRYICSVAPPGTSAGIGNTGLSDKGFAPGGSKYSGGSGGSNSVPTTNFGNKTVQTSSSYGSNVGLSAAAKTGTLSSKGIGNAQGEGKGGAPGQKSGPLEKGVANPAQNVVQTSVSPSVDFNQGTQQVSLPNFPSNSTPSVPTNIAGNGIFGVPNNGYNSADAETLDLAQLMELLSQGGDLPLVLGDIGADFTDDEGVADTLDPRVIVRSPLFLPMALLATAAIGIITLKAYA